MYKLIIKGMSFLTWEPGHVYKEEGPLPTLL